MAMYRSREMTHKFKMDAVQRRTSAVAQIPHMNSLNGQRCSCSRSSRDNGITKTPTIKSQPETIAANWDNH